MKIIGFAVCVCSAVGLFAAAASAADEVYTITLENQIFSPSELVIPANQKVKITIQNKDATPAEFESHDLKREKVIAAKKEAVISVGPLKPGAYTYENEFHDESKGTIVVK